MFNQFLEGTTDHLVCPTCKALREVRFSYGDAEWEGKTASNVMRGLCVDCGQVVAISAQSFHRFRSESKPTRERTTLTIPQELEDYMRHRLSDCGARHEPTEMFLRAALVACALDMPKAVEAVKEAKPDELGLSCRSKIHLNARGNIGKILADLSKASGVSNLSELVRRLILASEGSLKSAVEVSLVQLSLAYA
jgi:hypothetical protein